MKELGNNLKRLFGLHDLTTREASKNLNISEQALSELQSGKRERPRFSTIQAIARFFEVPSDRLVDAPFEELLAVELADRERFKRVEAKKMEKKARSMGSSGSRA